MRKEKSILNLTSSDIKELTRLSSWMHTKEWDERLFRYLGLKYDYRGHFVPKEYRKSEFNTAFHVAILYANKKDKKEYGRLDRVFIINYQYRNPFRLYNILSNGKLSPEVDIFQDDLFQMHKFLIKKGYNINSPS